jgi:hypothetical protein
LFFVLSFVLCGPSAQATNIELSGIWWMPSDKIVVRCKHDKQSYPWVDEVVIRGSEVQLFLENQAKTFSSKLNQTNWSKRWSHPEFELNVGLKVSKDSDFHLGTIQFKGSNQEYIGLWCFPQIR